MDQAATAAAEAASIIVWSCKYERKKGMDSKETFIYLLYVKHFIDMQI